MSLSNYMENDFTRHIVGRTASYVSPTTASLFIALSKEHPGEGGATASEPVGAGYARTGVASNVWKNPSAGAITNSLDITFNESTGAWGTVTHAMLYDSKTGGNMLACGTLATTLGVLDGDTVIFAASRFTIQMF